MIFRETSVKGAFVIEPEPIQDDRGFFARTFCAREFEAQGLNPLLVQCSISLARRRGTLWGVHYQAAPHEEDILIRCTRGSAYAVILDLRRDSPTYRMREAFTINAAERRMLYVPKGVADGLQTLEDDTEIFYQMSEYYHPECQRGIRYNDPAFDFGWPVPEIILSPRDQGFLDYQG